MSRLRSTPRSLDAPGAARRRSRGPGVWLPLLLTVAVATCGLLLPLKVFGSSKAPSPSVLAHLAWGTGADQVGLRETAEGLTRGPEALAVSPDGRMAILDAVNHRLLLLGADGAPCGEIGLAIAEPRFLAVDDQCLHVLDIDSDQRLETYSWSGALLSRIDVLGTDEVVTGLFATAEGAWIELGHQECILADATLPVVALAATEQQEGGVVDRPGRRLAGRPLGGKADDVVSAAFGPSAKARVRMQDGGPEVSPDLAEGRAVDHLVSVDTDGEGGLLVGARLVRPEKHEGSSSGLVITRLLAEEVGRGRGGGVRAQGSHDVLFLAESDFAYTGDPYVVAPDGRVFQAFADETGYTIFVHMFGKEGR